MATIQDSANEAREGIKLLMKGLNGGRHEVKTAVVDEFAREHNTLEQCFMRDVIKPILEHMATTTWVDGRNEASQRWAQAALKATENIGLPLI